MIRLAAILAVLAAPAWACDYPSEAETKRLQNYNDGDYLRLEATSDLSADLFYYNNITSNSDTDNVTLCVDGITVDVQLSPNHHGVSPKERIIIRPRGDFIAIPDEIDAADGETVSVMIVGGMM